MSESDLKEGAKIGPYVIEGILGRGGMGAVYRAHDERLLRTVALKVISLAPDSARPIEEFSSRLLREARAAAAISHPNVVSVFDVGEENGVFFMAMELVKGRTIRALVGGAATWQEKLRWLIDTARAIGALHAAGIIHRDVKPENVLVRDDGVVKLLDLGIARRAQATPVSPIDTVTGGGAIPGTPVYMSPEQLKGHDLEAATDQFSWGVVAYELLAGERPWTSKNNEVYPILLGIVNDPAPDIGERIRELPPVVVTCVMRALEKSPKARFATIDDAASVIEPFAAVTAPIKSDRDSAPLSTSIPPRVMEPAAFAATTKAPTTLSSPKIEVAEKPRRASRRGLTITAGVIAVAATVVTVWPRPKPPPIVATPRALSTVEEADHAYREGAQLFRDGARPKAEKKYDEAVKLDPTFALAHLELALLEFSRDPPSAEAHFSEAFQHRMSLDERGAALLEASEPYVRPSPDLEEWETRLLRTTRLHPKDPESYYYLGVAREKQLKLEDAKKAYEKALALAPDFVPAMSGIGSAERGLGHVRSALSAYRTCLAKSPVAVSCLDAEESLLASDGECPQAQAAAETWVELDPASTQARLALAEALEANGTPRPAVAEALRRASEIATPEEKKLADAAHDTSLALLAGKFEDAAQTSKVAESALPPAANRLVRASWALRRVLIMLEIGDVKNAASVADDFLQTMDAYPKAPFDIDPDIDFYEPLFRANRIDRAAFDAKRRAWIQKEKDTMRSMEGATQSTRMPMLWAKAWASPVETEDEAKEALALQSEYGALPPPDQSATRFNYTVGRVLALAGRWDEAIARLERMARACTALSEPQAWTRAHYYLGIAYEGKHDLDRARRAYGVVVERWGQSKTSETTKAARARLERLPAK